MALQSSLAPQLNDIPVSSLGTSTSSLNGSVGFPLPNTSVYIVGSQTRDILPVGFAGEICIGGAGVALGDLDPKKIRRNLSATHLLLPGT